MNAREAVARALQDQYGFRGDVFAVQAVMSSIDRSGFTIMSKEDVEAVRDKALDRASEAALAVLINDEHSNPRLAAKVENAIRSLKSKEGKIDR